MRIGVLGGTFNPVHNGHLRAAEEVREKLALDRILFVPAGNPPLKSSGIAGAEQRYRMAEIAVASNRDFEISPIEAFKPERSYTVDTLDELRTQYTEDEIFFIAGVDAFMDLPAWKDSRRLVGSTDFIVMGRPNYGFSALAGSPYLEVDAKTLSRLDSGEIDLFEARLSGGRRAYLTAITSLAISASDIRRLVGLGRSVKYLLPEEVESFIMTDGLYSA